MTQKRKLAWSDLRDFRVALMLAFGFSSGLPFALLIGFALDHRLPELADAAADLHVAVDA